MLNRSTKTPFRLSRLTFAFLCLALAVFTWGLQYKLSLYDPPQASSHQMPEAKLLSGNEQTKSSEVLLIMGLGILQRTIFPLVLGMVSLLFLLPHLPSMVFRGLRRETKLPWTLQAQACLSTFFFRPPPFFS
jgi:hypothetical protein